jgi:succinoglycan biosynthesis transport protein ExoP
MQPLQDPFAVSRRALDMEDYIDVVRRHRAWILGPMFAALVISVVVAFLWPDTYVSSAMIRVIPSQVSERMAPQVINAEMSQRVSSMANEILSRTALTNIINSLQLYPRDRKRLPNEDVVENMRKDIKIGAVGLLATQQSERVNAFRISFSYSDRILAQKVCQELVSKFIDANLRTQQTQMSSADDFFKEQLETRRKRLEEIDARLTSFRMQNQGRLPEQVSANISALQAMENRMGNLNSGIQRAAQDKMLFESRLSILKDQLRQSSQPQTQQSEQREQRERVASDRLASIDRDIQLAETNMAAMLEHYRENHPDVQRRRSELAVLKSRREIIAADEEAKAKAIVPEKPRGLTTTQIREVREIEAQIAATQSMIEAKRVEMENLQRDYNSASAQSHVLQGQISAMPVGEAKYDELLRERAIAKEQYEETTKKSEISNTQVQLTNRKQSEALELLDPANTPQQPTEPNRYLIVGAGLAIGAVVGMFIVAAREMKDTTLKSLKDVRAYTQLTVLGSVPLLENDLVVRRRRRLTWLAWSTACLAGVLIMAGSVVFYFANKT